jgi:hypothetical protein
LSAQETNDVSLPLNPARFDDALYREVIGTWNIFFLRPLSSLEPLTLSISISRLGPLSMQQLE